MYYMNNLTNICIKQLIQIIFKCVEMRIKTLTFYILVT